MLKMKKSISEIISSFERINYNKGNEVFGKNLKIYKDGSHYVGTRYIRQDRKKVFNKKDEKKEFMKRTFENFYYALVKENHTKEELEQKITDNMMEAFPFEENIKDFVREQIERVDKNFWSRMKRLKRKVALNNWNYFVTFTYDDKKHSAESFREKIRKCLSNLSNRRRWRYIGVFEFSPEKKRLHFHAILYVPDGEMVGELKQVKDYSTKQHKIQTTFSNTFFKEKFGRNDFEALTDEDKAAQKVLNYLLKYITKDGEKVCFSRGIQSEFFAFVRNEDIACEFMDFVTKFVIFDDCFSSKNKRYEPYKKELVQVCMFEENKPKGYSPHRLTKANPNYNCINFITNVPEPIY